MLTSTLAQCLRLAFVEHIVPSAARTDLERCPAVLECNVRNFCELSKDVRLPDALRSNNSRSLTLDPGKQVSEPLSDTQHPGIPLQPARQCEDESRYGALSEVLNYCDGCCCLGLRPASVAEPVMKDSGRNTLHSLPSPSDKRTNTSQLNSAFW